jgi:hypothetical protein
MDKDDLKKALHLWKIALASCVVHNSVSQMRTPVNERKVKMHFARTHKIFF